MKKIIFISIVLLISFISFSQQKVLVLDKTTRLPIPNITFWTFGNSISFTTNQKGFFTIKSIKTGKIYTKSAIYKDYNGDLEFLPGIVYLDPKKQQKENSIYIIPSEIQKTTTSDSVGMDIYCQNKIIVKWIKNEREQNISALDLYIHSITKNTTFKLRFFKCDSLQNPGVDFFDKEITVKTKGNIDLLSDVKTNTLFKKHEKVTINLEQYNIKTPNENFYVGIEFLQIGDNQFKPTSSNRKLDEKLLLISNCLSPFIAHNKTNYNDTMQYIQNNWRIGDASILLNIYYAE